MEENLFALIRAAMGDGAFEASLTADEWGQLYREAARQSLLGICHQEGTGMPIDVALQWAAQAESIRGLNALQNQEAARLTKLFADQGRRSAILKGQANARLYPDPQTRQPGDIDIWVEGGRESVLALLKETGLLEELAKTSVDGPSASYHHVHLEPFSNGVTVEVHFRPSSGNFNPLTNRRLQRWLEREILTVSMVPEGFCVPTIRFALVMQLAHIQRHFLAGGIGLRHICDYYWLLRNSTVEDRQEVAANLKAFGLRRIAEALMWVLGKVLHLDEGLTLCKADSYRGEWMLREIMAGGNFGHYAETQQHNTLRRVFEGRLRRLRLLRFDFWEVLWLELNFWKAVAETLPTRIKYRTLSLRDIKT